MKIALYLFVIYSFAAIFFCRLTDQISTNEISTNIQPSRRRDQ